MTRRSFSWLGLSYLLKRSKSWQSFSRRTLICSRGMLTKLRGWIRASSTIIWTSTHLSPQGSNHLGAHLRIILMLSKTMWWNLSRLRLLKKYSILNGWPTLWLWRRKMESSGYVYRSEEILFKKFSEPLPGSIDRTCFSINRTSCFKFFKNSALTDSNTFSKPFSNFYLSLRLGRLHRRFFVVFNLLFARFFSHKAGKTFIPVLLFLFSWFHALFHAF